MRSPCYPRSVALVAVSKTHRIRTVRQALAAGQRIFGENRVQEAASKFPQLRAEYPDLQLHLIGPLQTNKVKDAVALLSPLCGAGRGQQDPPHPDGAPGAGCGTAHLR